MNTQDLKYKYFIEQGVGTGSAMDMELRWLQSLGAKSNQVNDAWYEYLTGEGYEGALPDMQLGYLRSFGFTGSINDMWSQFWLAPPSGGGDTPDVSDVFNIDLYTGSSPSGKTIVNGHDYVNEDWMLWFKPREAFFTTSVFDTLRGRDRVLRTALANREGTDTTTLLSYNTDGYSLGSGSGGNHPAGMVSWSFKKHPKFLDIITYTGDGVGGRKIPHALGCQAGMVIVKKLSNSGHWYVQHFSRGGTGRTALNSPALEANNNTYWDGTAADENNVTLGNTTHVNGVGDSFVMYVFAHEDGPDGIIQCGEYQGSLSGTDVTLGWAPQYLLVKKATSLVNSGDYWALLDTARGLAVGDDKYLSPSIASEESSQDVVDPLIDGFKAVAGGTLSEPGANYIYMAIRAPS